MTASGRRSARRGHRFGGDWTTQKLSVLGQYLTAYSTALRDKPTADRPFRKAYIDAFAGTGYREPSNRAPDDSENTLFPDLAAEEPQQLLDGSARVALKTEPRFDKYIFIERHRGRRASLETLLNEFPQLQPDVQIRPGDANAEIQILCRKDWRESRAVLFLDPYGMQVEWTTIEAVARTQAIDLWLLFPLGIGLNRLLTRSGDIPMPWRRRVDLLLGNESWFEQFYQVTMERDLFGEQERLAKARVETIGRYFNERLREIFAGVADNPAILRNSRNSPLFLLCFAVANPRGKEVALRIANHLLRDLL